ncbi:hypothetical protein [Defluviimonas salinarum]|uniref:Uncharacterized protein n=1 Tax=Defluviimonas salinarum TaxID=2992147 RepID=A0ABT3J4X4_9RHOB|nr:hypothetical protein [Defluviimonas salinarum]MCW3782515.1 hypothetical protein [Defluviimonas salinarum]
MTKTVFLVGQPLPLEPRIALASEGSGLGGVLNLPAGMVIMRLDNPTPAEMKAFADRAMMRIGLFRTFLIVSPVFEGYNFDLLWSPAIARATEEPPVGGVGENDHLLLTLILVDERLVVRAIRQSTISPEAGRLLRRGQLELLTSRIRPEEVEAEMTELFRNHPRGLPNEVFDVACPLGS